MGISFGSIGATTAAEDANGSTTSRETIRVRRRSQRRMDTDALSLEAADILKLELLSGSRCGEISGLRAEEIDRQKCIWTLPPPSRSKNGRQRLTPVIGAAREITEQRLSDIDKGPLFLLAKGVVMTSAHVGHYLLTRRTRLPIATFPSHDLRRTFATMLAEMGIALDLVAAIVGHGPGGRDTPARWCAITYTATCLSERRARSGRGTSGSRASYLAKSAEKWCSPALGDLRPSNNLCLTNPAAFNRRLHPLPGPLTAKGWSASHTEIARRAIRSLCRPQSLDCTMCKQLRAACQACPKSHALSPLLFALSQGRRKKSAARGEPARTQRDGNLLVSVRPQKPLPLVLLCLRLVATPSQQNWRLEANQCEHRGMVTYCLTNTNCARADGYERPRTPIQWVAAPFPRLLAAGCE